MKEHEPIDHQGFSDKSPVDASQANKLEKLARFELLSVYIDGETTPQERRLVQHWLDTDPKFKQLYAQLLRLQKNLRQLPTPTENVELISAKVLARLDKRRNNRLILVGGGVIAALTLSIASLFLPERYNIQIAYQVPEVSNSGAEPLMIALNRPIMAIPASQEQQLRGR